jgi:muramoyltetrapeptide carboxypeptidase
VILEPHARIAAIAPSGAYNPALLEQGLAIVREAGFDVHVMPDTLRPHRYLASPDDHRLEQLVGALTSDRYDAIWMVRGGFGLTRLLPSLPYDRLVPKPIIGFSDVTALFAALSKRRHGPLVHGPMLHSLPKTDAASREASFRLLRGEPQPAWDAVTLVPGVAEGPIVGGNLAMIAALCGTPWQLDVRGCILALEDTGEAPYRVDRMLTQLRQSRVLDGIVGVALGEFDNCRPPKDATWTLHELLAEEFAGVPTIADLPFGHAERNRAFVWGRRARIEGGQLHTG